MQEPRATRDNLGFLLAKASQRWNELLQDAFAREGFPEVRASYGSVLLPLFEEDGLRMGEVAGRARLSKQTMTTMVRLAERDGLVDRRSDPTDRRATRVHLTAKGLRFKPVAERVLAELDETARKALGERTLSGTARALAKLAELEDGSGG
ncbi:MAG TPA: MarR family transcriptional regulator [Thermoleophilaceae bacterium]|nr:MarR family transcriptional regulator [Thermoleophilaceae bacterium]